MKNTFCLFLSFAVIGFGTFSCSSSDDNKPTLLGSWEYSEVGAIIEGQEFLIDYPFPYPECTKDFWEFTGNGRLYVHEFDSYDDVACQEDIEMSNYNISGNVLTIIDVEEDEIPIEFTIVILNKTTLKLNWVGINDFGEESTGIMVLTRKNN